ncbi:MAG: 50S ribosomal protein L11 methyltransferase [Planctomycetota bacterium]
MSWHELELRVDADAHEALTALLFELGCAGIAEELPPRSVWEPSAPDPAGPRTLRASFEDPDREALDATLAAQGYTGAWRALPDVDWAEAWKAAHRPLRLSPRIVVAPPWDAPPGALILEPGEGFGTGQHPTTALVAEALDALADQATSVLDVGCGSGILALAAARLGLPARGVDVHAAAVEEARAHAQRNGLDVEFSTRPLAEVEDGADLVLANVHAEVLLTLAPDLVRLTQRWLVLCGVLLDREPRVRAAFAALELHERVDDGRWVRLTYRR